MLSRDQLFATPWTVAHQAPLTMEFSSQEYWSGLPFPLPGNLPHPGTEPVSAVSPALAGWFFTTEPPGNLWVNLIKAPLFHQIEGFEKAESNVCFSLPMYIWYLAVSAWYIVVRYNIDLMNILVQYRFDEYMFYSVKQADSEMKGMRRKATL